MLIDEIFFKNLFLWCDAIKEFRLRILKKNLILFFILVQLPTVVASQVVKSVVLDSVMVESVKKGFDKNSNEQYSAYDTHVDAIARANSTRGLNALVQFNWLDATDIYDEILESEVTNESVSSISKERLEEFVNETESNETAEE